MPQNFLATATRYSTSINKLERRRPKRCIAQKSFFKFIYQEYEEDQVQQLSCRAGHRASIGMDSFRCPGRAYGKSFDAAQRAF
jgi:hypothetical protein